MNTPAPRPTPLREVAALWGKVLGAVGGVVSALVTAGILSTTQGDAVGSGFGAVDVLIAAIIGLLTAGSAVLAAFRTARSGEEHVTPVSSPVGRDGERLVPQSHA